MIKTLIFLKLLIIENFIKEHGGVIPEMAARQHLDILDLFKQKLKKLTFLKYQCNCCQHYGPGLIGGSYCWIIFCKRSCPYPKIKNLFPSITYKLILLSPRLVNDIKFPYLCLLVSGGNTALVLVKNPSNDLLL